ncbi:PmeII family type II restriction endonuclease [Bacillus chungangensis]|uniref:Type II restriction endonuclease EcoO109IR domain-containing protein n=1 Tax=Bacillus chungangensis TaxID=587633 RepID=A0ABT9WT28_9BACI|nr:PmeII family type II restriction endonuclease [Bacillus chungangensis]MDQ0176453.1 hypothetical protein [Bacillus chungangensis]
MEEEKLEEIVDELLNDFYKRRIEKINTLKLKEALSRKNPYLYKATGYENANDIIKEILSAYMSSSDEGIFGDAFFEVLAERVASGQVLVGEAEGIDVSRQVGNIYEAIAVKSGTNVFNAASRKKQMENFNTILNRIRKRKLIYQPIIGYAYGKKHSETGNGVLEIAGQVFWEHLTSDPNFYIKIIQLIGDKPQKHLPEYQAAFNAAVNRFTRDFTIKFCDEDGSINWEKLVVFNSGKPCKKLEINFNGNKALAQDEDYQIEVNAVLKDDTIENVTGSEVVTYELAGGYEGFEDVLLIEDNGIVKFASDVEPGTKVKIIISCYSKTATRTFSLKKERKSKVE